GNCPGSRSSPDHGPAIPSLFLVENFLCQGKGLAGRGNPTVNGGLEEHLTDILRRQTVTQRSTHVHGYLVAVSLGDQCGEHHAATGTSIQTGPCPDLSPGVTGDQILERLGEGRGPSLGTVHVRVTEHGSTHPRPRLVAVC